MKLLLNTLLIYLVVSIWSFGLANAQTINIYDEYKASRRIIKEIITDNNLEKTLTGYAYGGCFFGPALFLSASLFFSLSKKEILFLKYIKEKKAKEFKTPINLIWQTSG